MHTQKLFYEDCHQQQFTACVTNCWEMGKRFAVTLDRTAFYPEGGGQAADTGTLGNAKVLHVQESEGKIMHLCDQPLVPGQTVSGNIDYRRRFDLMQQHSGEHIVSGIVHKLFGYHNVGFHIGADRMEVDFDGPIPIESLAQIEQMANEAVWANLPVRCWYPEKAELSALSYRTKRALPWPVRIVEIPGFDRCACCGIHVASTGEIGIIKILSCVKFHTGVRLELTCGERATKLLAEVFEQNRQVSKVFSAKMLETGAAAARISAQFGAEKLRSATLQRQLFDQIAAQYAGCNHILYYAPDLSGTAIRELCEKLSAVCTGTAAVYTQDNGRINICLVSLHEDLKEFGRAMTQTLDGKGGGKPGFFQGSLSSSRAETEAFFRQAGFQIS